MSTELVEEENRENSLHVTKSPLKPLEQSRTVLSEVLSQSQKDNQVCLSRHGHTHKVDAGILMYIIILWCSVTILQPGTTSDSWMNVRTGLNAPKS